MAGFETNERADVFSKSVRAGKRTYFFDVKATKSNDYYLTITESKRFFEDDKYFYKKHKIFLYKEDFEKFMDGINEVIGFINENQGGKAAPVKEEENATENFSDIKFEDLGGNGQKEEPSDNDSEE